MKRLGNHGAVFQLHGHGPAKQSGSGIPGQGTPFGRVTVSGKAGELAVIPIAGLTSNVCQYQALLVQSMGGDVETSVTLVDPDLALDPTQVSVWVADKPVTAGSLVVLTAPTASAIKISFTSDSIVVIAAT